MNELNRSFRPTKGFFICWAILAVTSGFVLHRAGLDVPGVSGIGVLLFASAAVTFMIYGPFAVLRAAKIDGVSARVLIVRVALPVLSMILALGGILYVTDLRTENEALTSCLVFGVSALAVGYAGYALSRLPKQ